MSLNDTFLPKAMQNFHEIRTPTNNRNPKYFFYYTKQLLLKTIENPNKISHGSYNYFIFKVMEH